MVCLVDRVYLLISFVIIFLCLPSIELINASSYKLSLPNGMHANLKLPTFYSSYLPKPIPYTIKLPHSIAKDIFPNYAIRIASFGKPHFPVFRIGTSEYTDAQRLGVLPDSYPREEPGAVQLKSFHPIFPNSYRYTKVHYPGAFDLA